MIMRRKILKYSFVYFMLLISVISLSQSCPYYSGEFKIKKRLYYIDTLTLDTSLAKYDVTKFKHYIILANLYTDTVNVTTFWRASNLGQINYNGVGLVYDSLLHTYYDTLQRRLNEGINFSFSGNSTISGFTTSLTDTFPDIALKYILPDTLKKSNAFNLNFESITFCDEIELTMFDGQFRIQFPFNRLVPGSTSSISIPSTDLNTLDGNTVTVTISFIKNDFQIINSKRYRFERRFDIIRIMPLIN